MGTCREAGLAFMDYLQKQLGDEPDAVIVLVAHNLKRFDHVHLTREFRRHVAQDWNWPTDWLYLDSLILARLMYPSHPDGNSQVTHQAALCPVMQPTL